MSQYLGVGGEHANPDAVLEDGDVERLAPMSIFWRILRSTFGIAGGQQEGKRQDDKQEKLLGLHAVLLVRG